MKKTIYTLVIMLVTLTVTTNAFADQPKPSTPNAPITRPVTRECGPWG